LPDPQARKERNQPRSSPLKLAGVLNGSTGKKELFKKLLQKEVSPSSAVLLSEAGKEVLPTESGEQQIFPLSVMQQRYWLIDQLDPGTPLYNIFFASRIKGKLDIEALTRSLHEIVRRHEPLRSAFFQVDGTPMQRVCPPPQFPVPLIDLRALSPEERAEEEQRLLLQEPLASFDISQGLLLRATLLQSADTVFILMVNMHHVAGDGWSIDILRDELRTLYEAFAQGRPSPLSDLPVRYVDYVRWQHRRLQGPLLDQQLSYWMQQLANLPGPLHLPTDRPRSARQSFNGDSHRFALPVPLFRSLQELARNEDVTLFMTVFAVFQVLLCRLSGQEDILVGTPIANRTQADLEKLIGCFVNTIVFRTDMQGNPSFRALLQRVRSMALGAYGHQDVSFEQVLHVVRPDRDSAYAYAPLFQVMFHFDNMPVRTERQVALNVEGLTQKNMAAKFDISLRVRVREIDGNITLEGVFFYNTDLFDADTIERFARRFHCLLEAVVTQPDQRIWQLPMVSAEEQELLSAWSNAYQEAAVSEQELSVQALFEAQAARAPEAIALVAQGESLSYARLNQLANQLAQRLLRMGVGPETLVGICLPPGTPDLIVALLAILKAGGAYLPLAYPYSSERSALLLKDTRIAVLLIRQGQLVDAPAIPTLCLDADWSSIALESTANPLHQVKSEHAACVLSASGSAEGNASVVVIEHGQLLSYTRAIAQRIQMTPGSSVALLQPLTATTSITAIYPALCMGATLHLFSSEQAFDARALSLYFQQHSLDYLTIAPAHLAVLHADASVAPVMPLRCLSIEGETAPWPWLKKLQADYPACLIVNQYASAACVAGAITYLVRPETDGRNHTSTPVGQPLATTQAYILDSLLQPVPIYLPGELYIGGSQVARGYLGEPERTTERFIADPFGSAPDARLYRTGELARYLPDGSIELLGRVDDQLKIRGIWIEQGKIQAILSQHPAVSFVALLTRENVAGGRHLVAYVALREGYKATVGDLRTYLAQSLPVYMLPSAFVLLDTLPLTSHGLIDYQALPVPERLQERARTHSAPQNEVEAKLVDIWENLLQISPISVHDNFFDLGGNSLVAVRLMAKIKREFQQELPIAVLFQKATPEQLAIELLRRRWSTTYAALVEIQPEGTKRPFFCVHPIGGEVFCYAELARQLGSEQPFYGFQVPRQPQQPILPQTIEEMASAYLQELQAVQPSGPYLLGGWSMGGVIAFEMAQQLLQQGQRVALLALFESYPPEVQQQSNRTLLQQFGEDLEGVFSQKIYIDTAQQQDLSADEQLVQLYIRAKQANITPPDLELEQLQDMFAIYRRNIEAVYHYQPRVYPAQLTLFTTLNGSGSGDRTHGWQALATQAIEVHNGQSLFNPEKT
jgi:amino acid adenylation domain-containing protein